MFIYIYIYKHLHCARGKNTSIHKYLYTDNSPLSELFSLKRFSYLSKYMCLMSFCIALWVIYVKTSQSMCSSYVFMSPTVNWQSCVQVATATHQMTKCRSNWKVSILNPRLWSSCGHNMTLWKLYAELSRFA